MIGKNERKIIIPGNVPSSKNSRVFNFKLKRSFPSKTVSRYIKATAWHWKLYKKIFTEMIKDKERPYRVGLYFRRSSKRRFDYNNASQIITDLMVKNNWIEDDNADWIIPVFMGYEIDRNSPEVEITIL